MNFKDIKTIGVIGSGTMGRGIAISTATAGYNTIVYDVTDEIITKAKASSEKDLQKGVEKGKLTADAKTQIIERLNFTSDFNSFASADFIIEAAPESMDLKKKIFSQFFLTVFLHFRDLCKKSIFIYWKFGLKTN